MIYVLRQANSKFLIVLLSTLDPFMRFSFLNIELKSIYNS